MNFSQNQSAPNYFFNLPPKLEKFVNRFFEGLSCIVRLPLYINFVNNFKTYLVSLTLVSRKQVILTMSAFPS